jgi:hypothetical protein
MKKTAWLAVLFAALVIGYVVISSFRPKPFHCRVCMSFKGNRDCRTASADTQADALRTATSNACAQLAGGVIETSQCENTPPESVSWMP